jgi:hypothetical protein
MSHFQQIAIFSIDIAENTIDYTIFESAYNDIYTPSESIFDIEFKTPIIKKTADILSAVGKTICKNLF